MAAGGGRVGGGQSTSEPMRFLPGLLSLSLTRFTSDVQFSFFFLCFFTPHSTAGRAMQNAVKSENSARARLYNNKQLDQ